MNLQAWQTALAALVTGAPVGPGAAHDAWLSCLTSTPGFQVTCAIQQWWRTLRVETSAPLAVALLTSCGRQDVLAGYLRACPESSLFPFQEAVRFLEFLERDAHAAGVPHLRAVARFERAVLLLNRSSALDPPPSVADPAPPVLARGRCIKRHPLAARVRFAAPPHDVLAALLSGGPPPPPGRTAHWLLLAPRLPSLSRLASHAEARLLATFDRRPVVHVRRLDAALVGLWNAGALVTAACTD